MKIRILRIVEASMLLIGILGLQACFERSYYGQPAYGPDYYSGPAYSPYAYGPSYYYAPQPEYRQPVYRESPREERREEREEHEHHEAHEHHDRDRH